MKHLMGVALLVSLSLLAPAVGRAGDGDGEGHKKHKPPPAAFAACKDKSEGATCTFEGRKGTVTGTCRPGKKGQWLVCRRPHQDK
jgi:hypothetical protein